MRGDVEALNWLLHYCKCFVGSWNVLNPLCKALYSYNCIDRVPTGNIWDMQQPMFKYAVPVFCRFSCVIYFLYTVQPLFRAIPLSGKKFLLLWFMVHQQRMSLMGLRQRTFRWAQWSKNGPSLYREGKNLRNELAECHSQGFYSHVLVTKDNQRWMREDKELLFWACKLQVQQRLWISCDHKTRGGPVWVSGIWA